VKRWTLLAVAMIAVLAPAAALAHVRADRTQREAILVAVVRQHQLSRAQARCQVVTISTPDRRYASLTWPRRLSSSCRRVAANGVIVEHWTRRGWQFVTVGSSFRCPVRRIPAQVSRDLGICR
jgi:hypothetical protein